METFDVVMVCKFFDVLFGLRRCEIRSSDLFPVKQLFFENKNAVKKHTVGFFDNE
jgi:hypothetical protein